MILFRISMITLLSSLFLLSHGSLAANLARGKSLYTSTPNITGVQLSNCANAGCHTPDPTANIKLNSKCTTSVATCAAAIMAASRGVVPEMAIFSNLSATDTADIAAYILNPNAPALLGVSASSLTFSATAVNASAPAQTLTVNNNGLANLTVTSAALAGTDPGDFTATNNCTATVIPGKTCTISVGFKPTASGARSATLAIASNGGNTTVTLSGTGSGSPTVSLNAPVGGLTYPDTTVGATPSAATNMPTVTLTNTGAGALNISAITVSNDFVRDLAGTCSPNTAIAAGQNCTLVVKFRPTAAGARSGTLTITHNAAGSPSTIVLKGNGLATLKPAATLSPASLDFGNVQVGTRSAVQTVTLNNGGGKVLTISAIQQTDSNEFVRGGTCVAGQVPAGSSCTIEVTFTPNSASALAKTATISVVDDAGDVPNSQQTLSLTGTGTSAVVAAPSIAPALLDFGSESLNTRSTAKISTITNSSNTDPLIITALTIEGINAADFAIDQSPTNACTTTAPLPALGSCDIVVTFTPTASGARDANISATTNAAGSPHSIPLSGTGSSTTPVSISPATNVGGGGCTLDQSARFEPTLVFLLFLALTVTASRRARLNRPVKKIQRLTPTVIS